MSDICLRCGCPIQPGEPRLVMWRPCVGGPSEIEAYEIDKHRSVDDCMIALRRKEVESTQQTGRD